MLFRKRGQLIPIILTVSLLLGLFSPAHADEPRADVTVSRLAFDERMAFCWTYFYILSQFYDRMNKKVEEIADGYALFKSASDTMKDFANKTRGYRKLSNEELKERFKTYRTSMQFNPFSKKLGVLFDARKLRKKHERTCMKFLGNFHEQLQTSFKSWPLDDDKKVTSPILPKLTADDFKVNDTIRKLADSDQDSARIIDFLVDLTIQENGDYLVREKITVFADGWKIRRGIFRDFPIHFKLGRVANRLPFKVISVTKNGEPENYRVSPKDLNARILIGDANANLKKGIYTYEITYKTGRQFRFNNVEREFAWNVTGNDWPFRIERARMKVTFPKENATTSTVGFAGRTGSRDRYSVSDTAENGRVLYAEVIKELDFREGFSVFSNVADGVVSEPSSEQWLHWLAVQFRDTLLLIAGLLITIFVAMIAWWFAGRDPKMGTVMPRWDTGAALSSAAISFIRRGGEVGTDAQTLTALLSSLACKGNIFLKKEYDSEETKIQVTFKDQPASDAPAEEAAIWKFMKFEAEDDRFTIGNIKTDLKLSSKVSSVMKETYKSHYFSSGFSIFLGVLFLWSLIIFIIYWFWKTLDLTIIFPIFAALIPLLLIGISNNSPMFSSLSFTEKLATGFGKLGKYQKFGFGLSMLLLLFPIVGFFIAPVVSVEDIPFYLVMVIGMCFVGIFQFLIKAPTREGSDALTDIEGLHTYLSYAEKDRLAVINAPELNPAHFEKMLPFAIALGLEGNWTAQFREALRTLSSTGEPTRSHYQPSWSSETNFSSISLGELGQNITEVLETSYASASSGGGGIGGGFSGGGGGGGGGGGW